MESLLPGRKGIFEVLQHRPEAIEQVWIRQGVSLDAELEELLNQRKELGLFTVQVVDNQEFERITGDSQSQGIVAEVSDFLVDEEELIEKVLKEQGMLLICEQICDPQNLGALYRLAESSGATGVVITKDRSSPITPAVRKAAVGATELLPTVITKNLQRFLKKLKKQGIWIIGTALDSKSVPLYDAARLCPFALVLGAEGEGMRRLTKESCDLLIEIPMRGHLQSLNVSQAASIVLYELTSPERQKRKK